MKIKLDLHYTEPRLVDLYDSDNPRGIDHDFYIKLAKDFKVRSIIDLGCGTGLLTRELAGYGWSVTGIDPSSAMLNFAKKQPSAELVNWIENDSSALHKLTTDLVIMTGNVAQVFLEDSYWSTTLHNIYAALSPGGYVAFESRNPEVRAWENWKPESTQECNQTPQGEMKCWLELISFKEGKAHFKAHNVFTETGEHLVIDSTLKFRTNNEIQSSLKKVGFQIMHVYGNWKYESVNKKSRIMVFVAQRPQSI